MTHPWGKLVVLLALALGACSPRAGDAPRAEVIAQAAPGVLNAGFEGEPLTRQFPELNVQREWFPWWAEQQPIPAAWNPPSPAWRTKRPEFKPANVLLDECPPVAYGSRVHAGCNAQQWFAFYGVSRGGVYQSVTGLEPGATYLVQAWGHIWSAAGEWGCQRKDATGFCLEHRGPFLSDIATPDDQEAAHLVIGVDVTCRWDAFSPAVRWSAREFGYAEGLYDTWGQFGMVFKPTSDCVTLFVGGYNKYALAHNNFYLDDVSLTRLAASETPAPTPSLTPSSTLPPAGGVCTPVACEPVVIVVTATPVLPTVVTPTPLTPPAPTPAATVLGGETWPRRWTTSAGLDYRVTVAKLLIRSQPCSPAEAASGVCGWDQVGYVSGYWSYGRPITILCLHEWAQDGDLWGSPEPCGYEVMRWSAIRLVGAASPYMELVPGPVE